MNNPLTVLQVAIPCPLPQLFDYLPPPGLDPACLQIGQRLRVTFGRRETVGLILGISNHSDWPPARLKAALSLVDETALLPSELLTLIRWAARYYHYPLGLVVQTALPSLLGQGAAAVLPSLPGWRVTAEGAALDLSSLNKPRQQAQQGLMACLQAHPDGISNADLLARQPQASARLRQLEKKGWAQAIRLDKPLVSALGGQAPLSLNAAQQQAVTTVCSHLLGFQAFLLEGVTGSGKTEVYLQIIQAVIDAGRQALVLVPEINLTPQMLARFEARFAVPIAILHSRLSEQERLSAWLMARDGSAPIVLGTRTATWTPLARPGVFIIDEEHDASYKQQAGFQYSARDVTVMRARQCQVPVVLGSATPALDSLHNRQTGRYQRLSLPERAGNALPPRFRLIDLRQQPPQAGLSVPLLQALSERLALGQQSLVYINRRGFAPTYMCHDCGWIADCTHCSAHLTLHQRQPSLHCHHCGTRYPLPSRCPVCQQDRLRPLGYGTERIEQTLVQQFPSARILRIDSDNTRRKAAMQQLLTQIHEGEADILVGTQMLTKGHHFPNVTLVGVVNVDNGLFSMDFRGTERLAQSLIQVAGRAGRAALAGEVYVQSYHPDHPLLRRLLRQGYPAFAEAALSERQAALLPPYAYLALLRAETKDEAVLQQFLQHAADRAVSWAKTLGANLEVLGPIAALLKRRAEHHRGQLLLQASARAALHHVLAHWQADLIAPRGLRWSLDVDPQDLY